MRVNICKTYVILNSYNSLCHQADYAITKIMLRREVQVPLQQTLHVRLDNNKFYKIIRSLSNNHFLHLT